MARRLLVTGGCGFIGSHLVGAILDRGDEAVVVDNLDDYYDPALKRQNVAPYLDQPGFELIEADIRDAAALDGIGKRFPLDGIVHLAARAGVRPSIQDPALYADVNLIGTSNVFELARRHEIRNVVFASSSSVYGERTNVPFREDDPVDHPVSPYAATKKAGELLAHTYHHLFGIDITCLRFFTVYGPRQRPEMAMHKFTRLIHQGDPVPMYGDGSSQRDYTFVEDIVDGVLRAVENNSGYSLYNLGNHRMITLKDAIEEIGRALGQKPRIDHRPQQAGDVSMTCADITRARENLGYDPSTPFEDGIRKFVAWYLAEYAGIS